MTENVQDIEQPKRTSGSFMDRVRRRPEGAIVILFILVQATCIIAGLLFPDDFRYLSDANIRVLLKSIAPLGIMALGVGILMIAGEFDLSVGTIYTFSAIVVATLVADTPGPGGGEGMSAFVALGIGIAVGVVAGLINGVISIRFALPSFIVTLGAMLFWKGGTLLYHGATSARFRPEDSFEAVFGAEFGLIDASFIWFIGLSFICYLVLHHHKLGNHFFAVGGNKDAAIAIGVNPTKVKLIAFGIAGGLAAFSGVIAMTRVGSVQPGGGLGLELNAIAACVIGGAALMGGRGSIVGVVLGTALIYTIQDILLLLRAPGFYFDMFVGALIIFAAISNQVLRARN